MRFHRFASLLPSAEAAPRVAAPPYDVVNRAEARSIASGNPESFLHIGRSDVDLPDTVDQYDPRIYSGAGAALDRFMKEGILQRDAHPSIYLYRLIMNGVAQTGVVGCVHIDDYENNIIKKHERTRPDKEDDRTRHVLTLNANAEPVFLSYRDQADRRTPEGTSSRPEGRSVAGGQAGNEGGAQQLDQLVPRDMAGEPIFDFESPDGVRHTGWRVMDPAVYEMVFQAIPVCYVADGHHRCASAWRAGRELRAKNPAHTGSEEYNWFLAVLFPASQLRILPYNRLVRDLAGLSPAEFLRGLERIGTVTANAPATPTRPGTFSIYIEGKWHGVAIHSELMNPSDPLASLDASLLQEHVLGPLLKIGDPRTDKRIDFVGGIRGTGDLERRVQSGEMAVAFSLFPTSMDQLFAVADSDLMMPPKSTWFEPKLKSGLFVHTLD
jgi:uncharacterized protein (DUF1015 family)